MNVFDEKIKVLNAEIFPQHTITGLNSGITFYCFVQSGGNKHKHESGK